MTVDSKVETLLKRLKKENAILKLDGSNLIIKSEGKPLNQNLITEIKENKKPLILYFEKYIVNQSKSIPSQQLEVNANETYYPALPVHIYRYRTYKLGSYGLENRLIGNMMTNVNQIALSNAIKAMISRQESLRMKFTEKNEEILIKICNPNMHPPPISFEDLSRTTKKKEKVESIMGMMRGDLFDYQKEWSFRCKLIKYEKNDYLFLLSIDPLISDPPSLEIIKKELFTIYEALVREEENPLKPLKIQFRDYINYYLQHYNGKKLIDHQQYYKNLFSSIPPKMKINQNIFLNQKKHSIKSLRDLDLKKVQGGDYQFVIPIEISNQIKLFVSQQKISFFNFMLAVYCLFLNKVSNRNMFFIKSPISYRNDNLGFSKIIGWINGALITRVQLNDNECFNDLLELCKTSMSESMNHSYYRAFNVDLNLNWHQLGNSLNVTNDINSADDIVLDHEPNLYYKERVLFGTEMTVRAHTNGIGVKLVCKNDIIKEYQIPELGKKFIDILKIALNSPKRKIGKLDLMLADFGKSK